MRVSFLVDGFNVYHSLDELNGLTGASVKWLDLRTLCEKYLHAVRAAVGQRVDLAQVHWYSARPDFLVHRKPDAVARYDTYAAALQASGVKIHLSQFKRKQVTCPHCNQVFVRHEEKETDVAIATSLLEVVVTAECETVVLVTGDTDLVPAVKSVKRLLPRSKIGAAFPFLRHNVELEQAVDYSFKINQKDIERSQFPRLFHGHTKPSSW
jgi:uncharacterized LabA/DUF88 family protein